MRRCRSEISWQWAGFGFDTITLHEARPLEVPKVGMYISERLDIPNTVGLYYLCNVEKQ